VIAAGLAFAESSHPEDELFTINFNERVWSGLPDEQPFTRDRGELRRALLRSTARGQTALFDALTAALRQLDRGSLARKILLVVSDGGDNASRATFDGVLDAALRRDVVIYTIGLADANDDGARPDVLKKLSEVTGGEAFFPKSNDQIGPTLERIAHDIRSSYTLGYVPDGKHRDGAARRIKVDVHSADQRKLAVRARTMFIAPESRP
jgi:VWFA-related protein